MLETTPKNSIRISKSWIKAQLFRWSYVNKIKAFNHEWGKGKPNAQVGEEDVVNKEEVGCNVLPRMVLCLSHSTTLGSCYYYLDRPCLTTTSDRLQYFLNYLEIISK